MDQGQLAARAQQNPVGFILQVRCGGRQFRGRRALPESERPGEASWEQEKTTPGGCSAFCFTVLPARRGKGVVGVLELPPLLPLPPF